ncbi:MAG: hypothetical protein JJT90_17185 [Ectothiorhodospiraceae bacterium]|nr:hypothetical protein [Ectothiorhodospiraceae bacterium]
MNKLHLLLPGVLAGLLLSGCASRGEAPEDDPQVLEALGLQETRLDRPGLFDELFARRSEPRDEAREQRLRQLEAALEQMEHQRPPDRAPVLADRPRHLIGVLLDERGDPRLDERLAAVAPDYPIRLLRAGDTAAAMDDLGCGAPMDCATELRVYPGLRLILEIRGGDDPRFVHVRLHDLELQASSEERRLALPDGPGGTPPLPALDSLADLLLLEASDQARSLPWFARSIGQDAGGWVINAGRGAGLQEGDMLQVQRAGRALHGPGDRIAGWLPGEPVGTVRVLQVAGDEVALVEPVDGQAPGAQDILVPMDR